MHDKYNQLVGDTPVNLVKGMGLVGGAAMGQQAQPTFQQAKPVEAPKKTSTFLERVDAEIVDAERHLRDLREVRERILHENVGRLPYDYFESWSLRF